MQCDPLQQRLASYDSWLNQVLCLFSWLSTKNGSFISKFEKLQKKKYYFMTGESNMNFQL